MENGKIKRGLRWRGVRERIKGLLGRWRRGRRAMARERQAEVDDRMQREVERTMG